MYYRTFNPKNCHQALKNMGLGSGIREKPIPDPGPGVKKAPDPGSGSATLTLRADLEGVCAAKHLMKSAMKMTKPIPISRTAYQYV
jgi:hypothetical protein